MINRISYRIWQFCKSFKSSLSQDDWDRIRLYLSPVEIILFTKMPVPDQNHCFRVFNSVLDAGENDENLIKAALLHDIGKSLHPLRRWERIFAVIGRGLLPDLALMWGKGKPEGFKRPLVVIQQHPDWGAELAREADCSETVVWLIKNHENYQSLESTSGEKQELMNKLQTADNLS
jgi:putative nucleotidyltransferase with HDIG domain